MDNARNWSFIENNPGVFTLLLKNLGAKGVQIEELWSIDDDIFENLRPVHGLIFLFKFIQHEEPSGPVVLDSRLDTIYFAKQIITNASATQAAIHILMNCNHPDVDLGPELTNLKNFSMSFEPTMRGVTLSNSQTIKSAHNSVANYIMSEVRKQNIPSKEDAYHYVGYMPINGRLYELDGLRHGPIDLGPISPDQDWLEKVSPVIIKRINKYIKEEIHFNLMALVSDRKMVYERKINEIACEIHGPDVDVEEIAGEIQRLRMMIEDEDAKMERYQQEMVRRRHNFLPFIINLLVILAEEKKLTPLLHLMKLKKENEKN